MTNLERLSGEELIERAKSYRQYENPSDAELLAAELAKRLEEASKDSTAMDELAAGARHFPASADAFGGGEESPKCYSALIEKGTPLYAQIAKRKQQ